MKLIVDEVIENETLYQEITMTRNVNMVAIRPRIYKHNNPSGTLQVQIRDTNGEIVGSSDSVTISDINSADYSHSYYKFSLTIPLRNEQVYRIYLTNSGYTFNESAYCGWCRTLDLGRVTADYTPNIGMNSPFDFEIWERKGV